MSNVSNLWCVARVFVWPRFGHSLDVISWRETELKVSVCLVSCGALAMVWVWLKCHVLERDSVGRKSVSSVSNSWVLTMFGAWLGKA